MEQSKIKKFIFLILEGVLALFIIFMASFFLFNLGVNAQGTTISDSQIQECKTASETNLSSLVNLNSYLPVIPDKCSIINGQIASLPVSLLPWMAFRLVAFLTSLSFYYFIISMVYGGFLWSAAGLMGEDSPEQGKRKIIGGFKGLAIVVSAYLLIYTVVSILQLNSELNLTTVDLGQVISTGI